MSTTPFERPAVTNVREALRLFHGEGATFEIRMPKTKWRTVSGYFQDPDLAAHAVMEYDAKCEGIYFTLNPVLPDLLARSLSRLSRYAECTTSDQEVVRRERKRAASRTVSRTGWKMMSSHWPKSSPDR